MMVMRLLVVMLLAAPVAAQVDATFAAGRYTRNGISFELPVEWSYQGTKAAEPAAAIAHWAMAPGGGNFYARTSVAATPDVDVQIDQTIVNKTRQRERDGYRQWRVRETSVRRLTIDGHPALMAIADWQRGDGVSRVEYLAWIFTPASRLQLFASIGRDEEAAFQPQFERIAQSATLP